MDPIADFLTSVRNGAAKNKEKVDAPFSKLKAEIARVLKEEGFIVNYKPVHNESKRGIVRVFLKYTPEKESVIAGIKRISRPGKRVYRGYDEIPKVRGHFGVSIISTSQGVMSHTNAQEKKLGGEIICQVW